MTIPGKFLEELKKRREALHNAAPQKKIDERHAKGQLTARERLDRLFEPGTFQEMGVHARHSARDFGMDKKEIPGDGVVTGIGYIGGRPVAAFSQDFLNAGGSLGKMHANKICDVQEHAVKAGMPIIGINDSGGARIQEGVDALSGYASIFYRNVVASGVVPQITVIAGPCAGGAAYSPALTDFIIMVKGSANMFITGPEVIRAVTGQVCTMDEIGSAKAHASISGNIHFVADSDEHALEIAKQLLSYLPSNNLSDPPHKLTPQVTLADDPGMNDLIPADPKDPLDIKQVIGRIVDGGEFLEVQKDFAKNIVICFARIEGVVVGIIANQPAVKAGTLDIDASDKAARFVRFCNCFNIPLVTLVDVPGFLPGITQERGGIIRHGAKLLFAYSAATVPKVTVILRKAYGGAYIAMCCRELGADFNFAWPNAEIAVMGAEGAANVLYKKEIAAAPDPKAKAQELVEEYRNKFGNPYLAAGRNYIHDVIEPSQTRGAIALALRNSLSKRETRPPKKHGNMPL
jgi:propionyl-CoA carboxylase beta chain